MACRASDPKVRAGYRHFVFPAVCPWGVPVDACSEQAIRREPGQPSKPAPSQPAAPPIEIPVDALSVEDRIGLGDLLEAGIRAVRLDVLAKLWEKATGKSCGCKKRKEWLNRLASWKTKQ